MGVAGQSNGYIVAAFRGQPTASLNRGPAVQSTKFPSEGASHGKDQLEQGDPRGTRRGVIINIFEYILNGVVLAKDMEAAVIALGRQLGGGALAMFSVWGFLVGIFAVWLYAAIRPRYGAGLKTALCAGAAVWGLGYLLAAVTPIALHLFPRHIMAIGLAVGLVEVLVGTVAGAWLYHEETA
jgi:hypothetical protein